jgi:hypothetical protein
MTYAAQTTVKPDASRNEIERTLVRYGATAFSYGWDGEKAAISFVADGRQVRFILPLPNRTDRAFTHTDTGRARVANAAEAEYDKAVRQRWRALALVVKAKLEAVNAGIVTFEEEFLAHLVLPSGATVYEEVRDDVEQAYLSGSVAPLAISSGR